MPTVKHSILDRIMFDSKLQNDDLIRKTVEYSSGSEEEYNDLFQSFLQKEIAFEDKPSELMKGLIETMQDTTEFQNLRSRTVNDTTRSWFGMSKFSSQLEETLMEFKELNDLKKREERAKEVGDKVAEEMIGRDIKKYFLKNRNAIRYKVRQDIKEAKKEVDDVDTVLKVVGGGGCDDGIGQASDQNAEWVVPMMKDILGNKYIMQALEFAGRLTEKSDSIASANPNKKVGSLIGVTQGNDLANLLAKEYAIADDPELQELFWSRYADETLQVFDREAEETLAEGEIVLALDKSGSMDGEKYKLASGLVFAYHRVAKMKNRPFYCIGFDGSLQDSVEIKTTEDCMKFLRNFSGGGTDFDLPLVEACRIIGENPKFSTADIIFVTDGNSTIEPETLSKIADIKSKIGLKILGVSIQAFRGKQTMETFCDKVWDFNTVTEQKAEDFYKSAFTI